MLQGKAAGININKSEPPQLMRHVVVANDKGKEKAMEAAPVNVQKQVGETTITFDVAVPYTIVSDGKVQTVEIQRITAPADYKYVTLPKVSQLGLPYCKYYRLGKIKPSDRRGNALFRKFICRKIDTECQPVKRYTYNIIGTDNSILVKREKRKDFTSRKVIGANRTDTYSFF